MVSFTFTYWFGFACGVVVGWIANSIRRSRQEIDRKKREIEAQQRTYQIRQDVIGKPGPWAS